MDTQVPDSNQDECIYNANTQIVETTNLPNIYEMEAQLPAPDNLPEICKIQENPQINFRTDNKENDNNIYNAETQIPYYAKLVTTKAIIHNAETQVLNIKPSAPVVNKKVCKQNVRYQEQLNVSDDIIMFDEIDNEPLQNYFESQQLLSSENDELPQDIHFVPQKRTNRIESGSSTDCEDELNVVPQALNESKRGRSNKSTPRATRASKNKTHYVLFTAFANVEVRNKLEELGEL